MDKNNFDIHNLIKLFVNSIGQDSFKDFYGSNWEARKKEMQKLQKTEIQQREYKRFLDILNEWADWAQEKNYINSWDKYSIPTLLFFLTKSLLYPQKDFVPIKDFVAFSVMYAICGVFSKMASDMKKEGIENPFAGALSSYDFWISCRYEKDISPIEGVFSLFSVLAKDEKCILDFWNKQKEILQQKGFDSDLKPQIERWRNGKQQPSWKMIKLFLNEDLRPEDSLFYNPIPEENENFSYLVFRRKLFSAYFITRFFNSLEEQQLMNTETKTMIRRGVILFYRRFLPLRQIAPSVIEETTNPMFLMMTRFLVYKEMGYDFNDDANFQFFGIPHFNMYRKTAQRGIR